VIDEFWGGAGGRVKVLIQNGPETGQTKSYLQEELKRINVEDKVTLRTPPLVVSSKGQKIDQNQRKTDRGANPGDSINSSQFNERMDKMEDILKSISHRISLHSAHN
jgi:hypothetical protein